jgi:hypothetical protein
MLLKIPLLSKREYKILDEILFSMDYKHMAGRTCDYIEVSENAKKKLFLEGLKHGIQFEEVTSTTD